MEEFLDMLLGDMSKSESGNENANVEITAVTIFILAMSVYSV